MNLRTDMTTLKTLYHSLMTMSPCGTASDATVDSAEDDEMSQTLKQCMEENQQFKRENMKYLNQLKESNTKYTECNAKYIELSSLQRAQQNELRSTRSRAAELEEMLQDCFSEIRFLERECADLRQAVRALIPESFCPLILSFFVSAFPVPLSTMNLNVGRSVCFEAE